METNTQIRAGGYNKDKKVLKPFYKAYGQLKQKDQHVVKSVIMSRCKLAERYFLQKKNGERGITEKEEEIIQSTFQAFGIIWEPVAIQPEPANI